MLFVKMGMFFGSSSIQVPPFFSFLEEGRGKGGEGTRIYGKNNHPYHPLCVILGMGRTVLFFLRFILGIGPTEGDFILGLAFVYVT